MRTRFALACMPLSTFPWKCFFFKKIGLIFQTHPKNSDKVSSVHLKKLAAKTQRGFQLLQNKTEQKKITKFLK